MSVGRQQVGRNSAADVETPVESGGSSDQRAGLRNEAITGGPDLATCVYPRPRRVATGVSGKRYGRGDTFGRYVVIDEIGEGGMGVVYSAYDPELERKLAIKVLSESIEVMPRPASTTARASDRLIREAQALAKLSHPNVLPIFDVGVADGRMFMATEYVEGVTLKEWMTAEVRSWRAVVRCLTQAGRGLAAAHEAGLVHRDFKPSNVIMDAQGDVRVLDFGLARPYEEHKLVRDAGETASSPRPGAASKLTQDLTTAGAVLGTPSYMAPEQHVGGVADAAADQYAFCVSLYQGLYGQLPFVRGPHLLRAKQTLQLEPLHNRRVVPRWLRKVILRGLAPDPSKRWPSMSALLKALDRDPRRNALRATAGSVALATALTGGWAYAQVREHRAQMCSGASALVNKAWNVDLRRRIEQSFLATKASYAPETWARTEVLLDEYAQAWTFAHRDACEDTHVRGEQSLQALDLRMACLHRGLRELKALTKVFSLADETVVQKAVPAIHALPDVETCSDLEAQQTGVQPPRPAERDSVDAIREDLAQVNALQLAGKYEDARSQALRALELSRATEYRPLIAEATFALGEVEAELGKYEQAAKTVAEASWLAEGSRHDELAAEAQIMLAGIYGFRLQRMDEGLMWSRHAEAIVNHLPSGEFLQASLWSVLANGYFFQGQFDKSREYQERALEVFIRVKGPEDLRTAYAYNDLANALLQLDRVDDSIKYHERSLEIIEDRLGPHHPQVGMGVVNLGVTYCDEGSFGEAKVYLQRGIALLESSFGPDHPYVGSAYNGLAHAEDGLGHIDDAVAAYERAIEIKERALGPDHPAVFRFLMSLAGTLMKANRYEEAQLVVNRAEGALAASGQDPEATVMLALARARLLSAAGRDGHVIEALRKAQRTVESVPVSLRAALRQRVLVDLGRALRVAGSTDEAVIVLEQAVAHEKPDTGLQERKTRSARAHFELAQALWDQRDRESARDHARQALSIYESGEGPEKEASTVQAFLDQVDGSGRP